MRTSQQKLSLWLIILIATGAGIAWAGPLEEGHQAFDAQHYEQAYKLWLPLAQQGNAEAQYNLALLFKNGLGIPKDERKALEWFHQAAHQGMTDAMYNIGVMYYEGKGAYRSDKSAIEWWQLGADNNHPNCEYNLGVMYAYGMGIQKDLNKALKLWQAAAQQGHAEARAMLVRAYEGKIPGVKADPALASQWRSKPPMTN
ncbi:MAG: sel1 repeat family protein [Gammaproteobacteria bacterium]|nr:sel1 repeat family protein [Gammaproteobacteria bacterium]